MKLLVTGAWKATAEQLDALRGLGHEIVFQQQEKDPLVCPYESVEGVIANGLFLSHPIEKFTNLRYIQLTSAGFDRVPMDYVKAHGIEIHNARGVYSVPMAEHAIAGVLALYRRLHDFRAFQQQRSWEKLRDLEELNGKSVLILGCGSVGTECARRFAAFNCRVIGVDVVSFTPDRVFQEFHLLNELDALLPQADVVVLTLPLADDTRKLMDTRRLALLKDRAVVVSISRGAVIDQAALQKEIASNRLRAVLDVFDNEPLDEASQLWTSPNAIITPHVSFVGNQNPDRLAKVILENLNA